MDKQDNVDDVIASLAEQVKELQEQNKEFREQNKEFREKLDKLENQKTREYRDINSKLSNHAQKAIEASKGPLKPDQLQKFLTDEKHSRKILPIVRKYSNNIDGVKKQILSVYDKIETRMIHRKQQKELDDRLIRKIKKLSKSLEEEQEKEKKSKLKKQSTLYQYFDSKSNKASDRNGNKSTKPKVLEVSEKSKYGMAAKQSDKGNRKRKTTVNDESSSSQESGITRLSYRFSKRLKLNSPQYSAESNQSPELMSVEESDEHNRQHTEPMSVDSTESSLSSPEPMSLSSAEGSQSSPEPMSIVNSEESSSQLDAKPRDDSTETVKMNKPIKKLRKKVSFRRINQPEESSSQSDAMSADDSTKTVKKTKKIRGKVSKQPESRLGKDAANHNGKEETVPERQFRVRK